MPATVALQLSVALPDPVTLAGVIDPHVSPAETRSVSETVPEKPLRPLTMMFEVALWPTSTAAGELAAMVKSTKLNVAVAM